MNRFSGTEGGTEKKEIKLEKCGRDTDERVVAQTSMQEKDLEEGTPPVFMTSPLLSSQLLRGMRSLNVANEVGENSWKRVRVVEFWRERNVTPNFNRAAWLPWSSR